MDNSLFESYELDLTTLLSSLNSNLNQDNFISLTTEKKKSLLKRIESELDESDEIIAQMEIEVQTTTKENKALLTPKMKEYKLSISRSKGELKVLSATADRDDLLSSAHTILNMENSDDNERRSDSPSSQAQAQRAKLLTATDKLTEGQRRLEDSHRIALETEDLGGDILRDLRGQRDQLEHTRDNLYEADGSIDRASTTLKKMVRTMYQQRLVTYAIIAILVLLIGYVLFFKIF